MAYKNSSKSPVLLTQYSKQRIRYRILNLARQSADHLASSLHSAPHFLTSSSLLGTVTRLFEHELTAFLKADGYPVQV